MNMPGNAPERTVKERFEKARELLSSLTERAAERAIAELTPALGRTCGISEFRTLADLLYNAYTITGNLTMARAWLQYAPSHDTNETSILASSLEETEKNHGIQPLARLQLARLYLDVNEEIANRLAIRMLEPAYVHLQKNQFVFMQMALLLGRAHRRLRSKRNADFWFALAYGATRPLDNIESRFEVCPRHSRQVK